MSWLRAAALVAIGTAGWLTPQTGLGQTGDPAPPADQATPPARSEEPAAPGETGPVPLAPRGQSPRESAPAIRGSDCEREAPSLGV